jgi:hypothetical protein
MNRRDFLLLRAARSQPALELSCRRLYDQLVEAEASGLSLPCGHPTDDDGARSADALFARIEVELREIRRLRLLESEWLSCSPLGERMAPLLDEFNARGGRVELVKRS